MNKKVVVVMIMLVVTIAGSLYVFWSRSPDATNEEQAFDQDITINDIITPSIEEVLESEPEPRKRFALLWTHGLQKDMVARYAEATTYIEEACGQLEQNDANLPTCYYHLIKIAQKADDSQTVDKYTKILGQSEIDRLEGRW